MNKIISKNIDVSITAGELPDPMVYRPHVIDSIKDFFDADQGILCVEGKTGYGKTTLLHEFATTVEEPCFSIFLGATGNFSYDPLIARSDLIRQAHWYLVNEPIPPGNEITDGLLRNYWHRCAKKLNQSRTIGYVIVDGIDDLHEKDDTTQRAILDFLPLGREPFRVLFSVASLDSILTLQPKLSPKPFPIMAFSPNETREYLKEMVGSQDECAHIHRSVHGVPSLLATVRRQLSRGSSLEDLQLKQSGPVRNLFQSEWSMLLPLRADLSRAFAFIAALGRPADTVDVAKYCDVSDTNISNDFLDFDFLQYSTRSNGWYFSSPQFLQVIEQELANPIEQAREHIAKSLLSDPDSQSTFNHLPNLIDFSKDLDILLDWLREDRLAHLLLSSGNPTSTETLLKKIIPIARELKKDEPLTFYSVARSIIHQISRTSGLDEEIRARGALQDFEGAHMVAISVPMVTQRVRLLSNLIEVFADSPGIEIDPIRDEILEMVNQIDFDSMHQEDVIDLASDLYPVDSSLALKVLKGAIDDDVEDATFEVALAKITLTAIARRMTHSTTTEDGSARNSLPIDLLVDEKLKYLLRTASVSTHAHSAYELLDATESIDDVSERLYVQRKWLLHNYERDDAVQVLESALNDALTSTDYSPNASFYREITTSLPYLSDEQKRSQIHAILEGQSDLIKEKGPRIEYVRFQLHLAHSALNGGDINQAVDRVETLYLEVASEPQDLETRITSLAWLVSSVGVWLKAQGRFAEVAELALTDLEAAFSVVTSKGAGQFEAVKGALVALSPSAPSLAIKFAKKLNTLRNRDHAYSRILHTICDTHEQKLGKDSLYALLELIEVGPNYDSAVVAVTERLCEDSSTELQFATEIPQLLGYLRWCSSIWTKCKTLAILLVHLKRHEIAEDLCSEVIQDLITTFSNIRSPARKYSVACRLLDIVSTECPEVSDHVLDYLTSLKKSKPYTRDIERILIHVLDLSAKTVGLLCQSRLLDERDLEQFVEHSKEIRDSALRSKVLSSAAFYLWREHHELFSRVVNDHIWPILNNLSSLEMATCYDAWINSYTVVWLENRDRAREAIQQFPEGVKNHCFSILCMSLLRKQPPGEPFDDDDKQKQYSLSYSDIQNLLQLSNETTEDSLMFAVFEWIADFHSLRSSKNLITRDQSTEIARKMTEIAEQRLPIKSQIQHDGFKILCLAQSARISSTVKYKLSDLIERAKTISNDADRLYVTSYLASYLPQRQHKRRSKLFELVETEARHLGISEDRYTRFHLLAIHSRHSDVPMSTRAIKSAFDITTELRGTQNTVREDRLLDLAYRIDPELPMKLSVAYDDDPAREQYKKRAKRQIEALKLKRDLGDPHADSSLVSKDNDRDISIAAWNALGALNSGRMLAVDMGRSRDMLQCASNYPLDTAYPMYSWVFSNIAKKYAKTREASLYVRAAFEGMMEAARFVMHLFSSTRSYAPVPPWHSGDMHDHHVVVKLGQREQALQFIRKWIEESAEEFLTIVDPYFRTTDLELIRTIVEVKSDVDVQVITGKSDSNLNASSLSETYSIAWREMCDDTPPHTEILVVREANHSVSPIHDRWILSKNSGLRLGTSINSLGKKDSEISKMDSIQLANVKARLQEYRDRKVREFEGRRILYESFELHS